VKLITRATWDSVLAYSRRLYVDKNTTFQRDPTAASEWAAAAREWAAKRPFSYGGFLWLSECAVRDDGLPAGVACNVPTDGLDRWIAEWPTARFTLEEDKVYSYSWARSDGATSQYVIYRGHDGAPTREFVVAVASELAPLLARCDSVRAMSADELSVVLGFAGGKLAVVVMPARAHGFVLGKRVRP